MKFQGFILIGAGVCCGFGASTASADYVYTGSTTDTVDVAANACRMSNFDSERTLISRGPAGFSANGAARVYCAFNRRALGPPGSFVKSTFGLRSLTVRVHMKKGANSESPRCFGFALNAYDDATVTYGQTRGLGTASSGPVSVVTGGDAQWGFGKILRTLNWGIICDVPTGGTLFSSTATMDTNNHPSMTADP
jgi:hypothetical protein